MYIQGSLRLSFLFHNSNKTNTNIQVIWAMYKINETSAVWLVTLFLRYQCTLEWVLFHSSCSLQCIVLFPYTSCSATVPEIRHLSGVKLPQGSHIKKWSCTNIHGFPCQTLARIDKLDESVVISAQCTGVLYTVPSCSITRSYLCRKPSQQTSDHSVIPFTTEAKPVNLWPNTKAYKHFCKQLSAMSPFLLRGSWELPLAHCTQKSLILLIN